MCRIIWYLDIIHLMVSLKMCSCWNSKWWTQYRNQTVINVKWKVILQFCTVNLIFLCYRFWYVSLVACYRNLTTCKWHHIDQDLELEYDIWLVNGNPNVSSFNPLVYQFSFDRQVQEMWIVTVSLMQCLYAPNIHSVSQKDIYAYSVTEIKLC